MDPNDIYSRIRDEKRAPLDPVAAFHTLTAASHEALDLRSKREFELDLETDEALALQDVLGSVAIPFAYHEPDEGTPWRFWDKVKWNGLWEHLSEEEQIQFTESLEKEKTPIKALLKIATPAPFGKGSETVMDTNVRKAYEIPASKLPDQFQQPIFGPGLIPLCPHDKQWSYKLYKMHLYGPGGKFEEHADTVHSSNHVATIVVSLPSEHKGGALVVSHREETARFDFSAASDNMQWAAFYTDCIHKVEEVTEGWRVVLQSDVLRGKRPEVYGNVGKLARLEVLRP